VSEDAAQLLGVELLIARLEPEPRKHGDMAHLFAS
jgi:hypothetical protein